jgi:hypothetical protein
MENACVSRYRIWPRKVRRLVFGMETPPSPAVGSVVVDMANGPWLSPQGAVLLSAASAALFAIVAMWVQWRIARKRATLDTLVKKEWDRDYIEAKKAFNRIRDSSEGFLPTAQ